MTGGGRALWWTMLLLGATPAALAAPVPERRQQLLELLRQDCGSCHGLRLTGGLGPALTPAALAGKDAGMLRHTILDGRAGTPMPPWRPFLSDAEAAWLVQQLQTGAIDVQP